ncbi:MAG: DUF3301 domain-containing protein [Burkholderiales bacterium]
MEVTLLLVLIALVWLWQDSLRAREAALQAGKAACQRQGMQFLDDTLALASLRLGRNRRGQTVLRRVYRFEFSDTGNNRLSGSVVMAGGRVDDVMLAVFLDPGL